MVPSHLCAGEVIIGISRPIGNRLISCVTSNKVRQFLNANFSRRKCVGALNFRNVGIFEIIHQDVSKMFLHDAGGSEVSRDCLVGSVLDFESNYLKI